jgi:hypothetical protein
MTHRRHVLTGLAGLSLGLSIQQKAWAMSDFTQQVAASLPQGMTLPAAFVTTMDWMAANDFVRDGPIAYLEPASAQLTSETGFKPVDSGHVAAWLGTEDPAYVERLAPIIPTGGDGSYAALWRGDDDSVSIVHMGSGSGSTMTCVLAADPVDMLRLMAIGYSELCWPETLAITPEQEHANLVMLLGADNVPPYRPPAEFRRFVAKTFNVAIPERGTDIVRRIALMESEASDDPFWQWVRAVQR